jgi:calcium-dependent protein kinase
MLKNAELDFCQNKIKLVDFGLSTQAVTSGYNLLSLCGTPGFIAPEIATLHIDNVGDHTAETLKNCDVFSVGVILFLLLTGEVPFEGKSFDTVLKNNRKGTVVLNHPKLDEMDPEIKDLLEKLLEVDYKKRPTAAQAQLHPFLIQNCYKKRRQFVSTE